VYILTAETRGTGSVDNNRIEVSSGETGLSEFIPEHGSHLQSVVGCEGVLNGNTYTIERVSTAVMQWLPSW